MHKYTINPTLYAQALEELAVQWRRKMPDTPEPRVQEGVRNAFTRSWQLATDHHEEVLARQSVVADTSVMSRLDVALRQFGNASLQEKLGRLRQTISQGAEKSAAIIAANHRAGLIQLFTMNDGVSQTTAEQIVDKHILVHK